MISQTCLYVYKGLDGRFQKKKIFIVREKAPHFSEDPGFSLPSLLVNPALHTVKLCNVLYIKFFMEKAVLQQ